MKLADFGLAKIIGPKDKVTSPCGTLAYIAPEVAALKSYHKEVDLWGLGMILYVMLRGSLPFNSKHEEAIEWILNPNMCLQDPFWNKISEDAKDLIKNLLERNSGKRFTTEQLLEHSWLKRAELYDAKD